MLLPSGTQTWQWNSPSSSMIFANFDAQLEGISQLDMFAYRMVILAKKHNKD